MTGAVSSSQIRSKYTISRNGCRTAGKTFELPTRKSTESGVTDAAAGHIGLRIRVQEELIIIQLCGNTYLYLCRPTIYLWIHKPYSII